MSEIRIRKAKDNDLSILLDFEQSIIEYERPFEKLMKMEHFNYYDLQKLINSDAAEVLVAEIEGELVGSGYAKLTVSRPYLKDERHAFFGFMYVAPDHRGKGINQTIIHKLVEWSKNQGMKSACLTVFEDNESAIKAYNKVGFRKQFVEMRLNLKE